MAFAVRAISQGTSCSQPCIPGATKAFLFELSENSPSCPFTQEHCEPPVAIVVKIFCSHRGPASSKEPQSPHSAIVSSVTHSSHRTHSTDFNSGPFFSRHMGPSPPQVCTHWLCSWNELLAVPGIQHGRLCKKHTLCLDILSTHSWIMFAIVYSGTKGGGTTASHSNYPGIPRGCSIIVDSTNLCQKHTLAKKVCLQQGSIWQWREKKTSASLRVLLQLRGHKHVKFRDEVAKALGKRLWRAW